MNYENYLYGNVHRSNHSQVFSEEVNHVKRNINEKELLISDCYLVLNDKNFFGFIIMTEERYYLTGFKLSIERENDLIKPEKLTVYNGKSERRWFKNFIDPLSKDELDSKVSIEGNLTDIDLSFYQTLNIDYQYSEIKFKNSFYQHNYIGLRTNDLKKLISLINK